jgi:hypothetical protein
MPVPAEQSTILRDSLELLFAIECLVVAAYLEVYMPFFYATYILVMARLPSAQFHSEMAGVTPENVGSTVLPLFAFGLLQLASFGLLMAVIYRYCKMHGIYQLAFVLETHLWSIQSKPGR